MGLKTILHEVASSFWVPCYVQRSLLTKEGEGGGAFPYRERKKEGRNKCQFKCDFNDFFVVNVVFFSCSSSWMGGVGFVFDCLFFLIDSSDVLLY